MQKKKAIILRGLPGSGKSYKAKEILTSEGITRERYNEHVFSTDSYFYNGSKYQFDPSKLSMFHNLNLTRFISALAENNPLVVCDNTNICHWEYAAYLAAAKALDYEIEVIDIGDTLDAEFQKLCAARNQHKVSLTLIEKMANDFLPATEI